MRLDQILKNRELRSRSVQPLYPNPTENLVYRPASAYRQSPLRRLKNGFSPFLYKIHQGKWRSLAGPGVADWARSVSLDGKYRGDLARRSAKKFLGGFQGKDVLLPGCHFNSQETRDWLSTDCRSVRLIDIVDWSQAFQKAKAEISRDYRPTVSFHFGSLEKLPFTDGSFDLIETRAVLEHVGNIEAAAREMARVLRPGGVAIHSFGPLYFCAGGDHCIGAYGQDHVYDHLLLDEDEYQKRLRDEQAFQQMGKEKSDARYWAIQGIFSYLKPREYLEVFQKVGFAVEAHSNLSGPGITFRARRSDLWANLKAASLENEDLLVSGILAVLRAIRSK